MDKPKRVSWNKGLTKDTNEILKKISINRMGKYSNPHSQEAKDKISKSLYQQYSSGERTAWLKGKKHTEESKKRMSITRQAKVKNGTHYVWCKGLTKETNESVRKMSNTLKNKILTGEIKTQSDCKHYKAEFINELQHSVRSSWEKSICLRLHSLGVKYEYEPKRYKLEYEDGEITSYLPDLYLPDYNLFIEIKGYFRKNDMTKIKQFRTQYPEKELYIINKDSYKIINKDLKADTLMYYINYRINNVV